MLLIETDLLEVAEKLDDASRIMRKVQIALNDPDAKFNKKTIMKEMFKSLSKREALICVMRENSACMNINDIANKLFNFKDISPVERTRHMKALHSMIKRTPEVVSAENGRGFWKMKKDE